MTGVDIVMVAPAAFRIPEASAGAVAEFVTMTGLATGVWWMVCLFIALVAWTAYDIGWRS